jgi:hypothetical protein
MSISPLATTVLDYLQTVGDASPRDASADLGINAGSFTSRVAEIRKAGIKIDSEWRRHPGTGQRYKRYFYAAAA